VSGTHGWRAAPTKAFLLMVAIASCAPPRTAESSLRTDPGATDHAHLQEACNVTGRVCTRCHDFARVTLVKFDRPERWQLLVSRMRYMQSSGITDEEARKATECLVYKSFGQAGLDELAHHAPPAAPAAEHHGPMPASSEPAAPASATTPAPETSSAPAKEIP
jgi:hypothetical protein